MTQASARHFAPISFMDRFPGLDGIRALAILMVFFHHYGGGSHGGRVMSLINDVRLRGWAGVDLFFVLSGFLITGILYDTRFDSHYFKRFFLRRSVRIFPIFYLVVVLLLILTPILHYQLRAGHLLFLVYLGNFIGNYDFSYYEFRSPLHQSLRFQIGHFWSLCVEEQFYMIWPAAVWWVRDRVKLIRVGWAIVGAAIVCRGLLYFLTLSPELTERWGVRTLPFRMDSLMLGGILALLLRGENADRWQRMCRPAFLISFPAAVWIAFFAKDYDAPWFPLFGFTLIGIASASLIGMTLRRESPVCGVLSLKPLRTLGKYSYGFYVYHVLFAWEWVQVLIWLMKRLHSLVLGGLAALLLNFVLTFLVSKYSYDLFEVRFLRLKKHFEYDKELEAERTAENLGQPA